MEYFDLLRGREHVISLSSMVSRMRERFGQEALRPAANLEFNSMTQGANETLEEWGDRVMSLAEQALGSSTSHETLQEQMVLRFLIGCNDQEASQHLMNHSPSTLEEAIQKVKNFKLARSATRPERQVSQLIVSPSRDSHEKARSCDSRGHLNKGQVKAIIRDSIVEYLENHYGPPRSSCELKS